MQNHTHKPLVEVLTDLTVREGSQQESDLKGLSVPQKLQILELAIQIGVRRLEFTAFAPLFPDREELATGIDKFPKDLTFRALYFNLRGLGDLFKFPRICREGIFHTAATDSYRQKNYRQESVSQVLESLSSYLEAFARKALSFDTLLVSAVLGDKSGALSPQEALDFCTQIITHAANKGFNVKSLTLADTEGVAGPESLQQLFSLFRRTYPDKVLRAHLHPPYSKAEECIMAGLEGGGVEWEAGWGGIGGSPFADKPGGNLDIRWLIKVWNKNGWQHGMNLEKIPALVEYLRAVSKRQIPEISLK